MGKAPKSAPLYRSWPLLAERTTYGYLLLLRPDDYTCHRLLIQKTLRSLRFLERLKFDKLSNL